MACTIYGFQDRPNRPLWHPSGIEPRASFSSPRVACHDVASGALLAHLVDDVSGDEDRDVDGHGDGDGVAGAGVDLDDLAGVADPELGVIGVVAQLADEDVLQLAAEQLDGVGQQVVGQGARGGEPLDAAVDAGRLEDADHDRERALAIDLLEENDLLLVVLVDDDPRKFHLHGHGHRHPPRVRISRTIPETASGGRANRPTLDLVSCPSMIGGLAQPVNATRAGNSDQPSPSRARIVARRASSLASLARCCATTSAGARATNDSFPSFPRIGTSCLAISARSFRRRASSAALSIRSASGRTISTSGRTTTALSSGRSASPGGTIVTADAWLKPRRNGSPRRSSDAAGSEATRIGAIFRSFGTFRSARRLRSALVTSCQSPTTRSASGSDQSAG